MPEVVFARLLAEFIAAVLLWLFWERSTDGASCSSR